MPFVIDVNPVAFPIGPLEVRWYGLAVLAAITVAQVLVRRAMRRQGVSDAALARERVRRE